LKKNFPVIGWKFRKPELVSDIVMGIIIAGNSVSPVFPGRGCKTVRSIEGGGIFYTIARVLLNSQEYSAIVKLFSITVLIFP